VTGAGPPPDPRDGRFQPMARGLHVALVLVGSLAILSVVVPAPASDVLATLAVIGLLVAPLVRVAWLAQRWLRRGDLRYGMVAVSVLLLVATGALIALR